MATNWFILASGNAHKSEEFNELFDIDFLGVKAAPEKIEVEENGRTFSENALIKAEAYYKKYKKPVLSDDSGLVVSALPGELGIHSARFGGDNLDDTGRTALLLSKLEGQDNREAYFVCVLCFYLNPGEIFFFEGRCQGSISSGVKGDKGFGYDPVFVPEGRELSFAEDSEWKQLNSHRAKAVSQAQNFFGGFFSK